MFYILNLIWVVSCLLNITIIGDEMKKQSLSLLVVETLNIPKQVLESSDVHFDRILVNSPWSEDMTDTNIIGIVFEKKDKQFLEDFRLFFAYNFFDFPTLDVIFEVDVEAIEPQVKLIWCIMRSVPDESYLNPKVEEFYFYEVFQEDPEQIWGNISSLLLR